VGEPLRVCCFESRRATEMASLLERQNCQSFIAPSLRERPLDENPVAIQFGHDLFAGQVDVVVFMTGVGAKTLLEALETRFSREQFFAALRQATIVVRGPKPTAVLREWGVPIHHRAPEPNTWRELLATLDAAVPLNGCRIAVQEYGKPNLEFYTALEARGAQVQRVPVYRWDLPEDCGPLEEAIRRTINGDFDVLMWTSAQQIHHVLQVAERLGLEREWRTAAQRCVTASIGPTATETLESLGFVVDLEPEHPKMGPLVKLTAEQGPARLAAKRFE